MATTTSLRNILGSEAAARAASSAPLRSAGFTRRTSGTKALALAEPLDLATGYWANPSSVSSKPPRWIVQFAVGEAPPRADLARDERGEPLPGAGTPGYINNGEGKCAVAAFRIKGAVREAGGPFAFPDDWEWIVQFAFAKPLPLGTSGDTLSDFDASGGTLVYKGRTGGKSRVSLARVALIPTMSERPAQALASGASLSYEQATRALADWLGAGPAPCSVYDPLEPDAMLRLADDLSAVFDTVAAAPAAPTTVLPAPELLGIPESVYRLVNAALAIGKRHFVFHGPPGTGKTTLAEYVAEQISGDDQSAGEAPYTLLTASSSWSSQDLVGGYQPLGPGRMGFIPGAMLRGFHKPIIVDELNRCPIDKVIGPLFSVLSGQATTLPYRVDVADPESPCYRILPRPNPAKAAHEFAPGPAWAMLCTLNQVDKTQLEQISFALSRRFTWIRIGIPEDIRAFVRDMADKLGLLRGPNDPALPNPLADMWAEVNKLRELGPAPAIDFMRLAAGVEESIDFLAAPSPSTQEALVLVLASTFLPLLDGISRAEARACSQAISAAWGLPPAMASDLDRRFMDLAP